MEYIILFVVAFLLYLFLIRPLSQGFKQGITEEPAASKSVREKSSDDQPADNWEGSFWDVQTPRNFEANLAIKYRDGNGSVTNRNIHLMRYGPWEGGALLWAFCELRKANRSFRTDRVISCVDLDTGEVIENLATWLDTRYASTPDYALEKVIEEAWDAIRVLFYVSKADGRLTQKERAILRDAIKEMSNHPAIDDKRVDDLVSSLDVPSVTAFKQAFGRLINQNKDLALKVAEWANALIATEKTISAIEQEAIDYLNKRLAN